MNRFPIPGLVASLASLVAITLISDRLGDNVPVVWFCAWSVGFGLLVQGVALFLRRQPQSFRRPLPLAGMVVIILTAWIAFVAVAGLIVGLYSHRMLNPSGISAWGIGAVTAILAFAAVERSRNAGAGN